MLTGTASPESLTAHAATMASFDAEPVDLGGVELLKVTYETRMGQRTASLPPALHPSNPPTLIVHVWRVAESPWGPFAMAEARVGCRSGTRPRGFVIGCIVDGEAAAGALAAGWGFPVRPGSVELDRGYDRAAAAVHLAGERVCEIDAIEPEPLGLDDIAWTTTMTLAHTPSGLRLVQVDVDHTLDRSERLTPRHLGVDAAAWIHPTLDPYHPVSAAVTVGRATLPALRFVARPDELGFTGTERVGSVDDPA